MTNKTFVNFVRSIGLCLVVVFCTVFAVRAAELESRHAQFGDMKIHYQIGGKSEKTIVFVHGWASDATFWQQQTAAFPDFRIIAIDLPGHGQSDQPPIEYTMDVFARAVAAVLKDARVKRAVLVGHSMGTPVIRQFYRLYPKKTQALVIVDGPLRPYAKEADWKKMFAPLRENYRQNAPQYARVLANENTPPAVVEKLVASMLATPAHVAVSAMDGMAATANWTDDRINVPVLAVMAKTPPLWKEDSEKSYGELAPNLEFLAWDDVSHMLMLEQPERFNQTLRAFLVKNKFAKK